MIQPSDLSPTERCEFTDRVLMDLEGMKKLGPEFFDLRTRLITQTAREFLSEVATRRGVKS